MDKPTDTELRRFVADSNMRRHGWAAFQKGVRRSAERLVRNSHEDDQALTALDAHRTAAALAEHGHLDPDAVTHADIDAAADYAGTPRPEGSDDRHAVRAALAVIGNSR